MFKMLEELCNICAPSGAEETVREYIIKQISPYCDVKVDKNGNVIAFKKGKNRAVKKVMLDAHMDEVGVIITDITEDGFLHFETVGGIETEVLLCSSVNINGTVGVIGSKPIHQSNAEERKTLPKKDGLYIDIGADTKEEAEKHISVGDTGTFNSKLTCLSDNTVRSKALDDRFGCFVIIELLKKPSEYDFYATFTMGEELGLRGATTAAYTVYPDFALVLEATTAGDLHDTPENKRVCRLHSGAVVSFMDHSTLYERKFFDYAIETAKAADIKAQPKCAVAGGNNAGAIHLSRGGIKTLAISLPCRYIHSPSSVASTEDMESVLKLTEALKDRLAGGEF